MKSLTILAVGISLLAVSNLSAATHYVSLESTNPIPPYTNWATAATNIQDAVEMAAPGDVVMVTNGLYAFGATQAFDLGMSRVVVSNAISLQSAKGPQLTIIDGGGTNRCIALADGASLTGFTLTNGFALEMGGGVYCSSTNARLTNCTVTGNSVNVLYSYGSKQGGGAYGGTLYNCTLSGNSAWGGGGVYGATLYDCMLINNRAETTSTYTCPPFPIPGSGGAAYDSTLHNCMLTGNSSTGYGGGASGGTLSNCTVTANSAAYGGGAHRSTVYNCTLTQNSASSGGGASGCRVYNCTLTADSATNGGGAYDSEVYNCAITRNSAIYGGGASGCRLYNCTMTGNFADGTGGGASAGLDWAGQPKPCTLYNCIVYFNTAASGEDNYETNSILSYCCTSPIPADGVGNIAVDPQLASASHVSADSPCRGAGAAAHAAGTDIDGETWLNPPSMGSDEYHHGGVKGPLDVCIQLNWTNVAVGYPLALTALIGGRTTDSVWDFGDGYIALNEPYTTHCWRRPGAYRVALWAFNESNRAGVRTNVTINVVAAVYVNPTSGSPQPPYTSWATAATNIQDAVDAPVRGATVVVTNGVYPGGLTVTNPVKIFSVNGPQFTLIDGGGTNYCVSLPDSANLSGFTLTNGMSQFANGSGVCCASTNTVVSNCFLVGNSSWSGGGAYGGTLYNCVLSGNSANYGGGADSCTLYDCTLKANSAQLGGGVCGATLNNCTLTGNSAIYGGGAYFSTLHNCTLARNSASDRGGGAFYGNVLYNCIVYFNTAPNYANYDDITDTLNYCCTTPLPSRGIGNIAYDPRFVDYAHGNLRLQANSLCINAANNAYVITTADLDCRPRIISGRVDMGAYEFQPGISGAFIAWLQQYGLPTDGSADFIDFDVDGHNNWQEWVCGTCPTNASSALRLLAALPTGTNVTVSWESAAGINYLLERSTNLAVPFSVLATNIVGQAGTTSYADTNATSPGPFFYRVGVTSP